MQQPGNLVVMGNFNFHWDDPTNSHTRQLCDVIDSNGMTQHVNCFTHRRGHILDLVITRTSENTIQRIHVEDPGLSDHSAIFFRRTGKLPAHVRRTLQYRLHRSFDTASFNKDLCTSDLVKNPATSLTARVD